jgi:hypothetical protein
MCVCVDFFNVVIPITILYSSVVFSTSAAMKGAGVVRFQHILYCLALYSGDAWSRN